MSPVDLIMNCDYPLLIYSAPSLKGLSLEGTPL